MTLVEEGRGAPISRYLQGRSKACIVLGFLKVPHGRDGWCRWSSSSSLRLLRPPIHWMLASNAQHCRLLLQACINTQHLHHLLAPPENNFSSCSPPE